MSLIKIEGFECFGTTDATIRTGMTRKYTTANSADFYAAVGQFSDRALEMRVGSQLFTIPLGGSITPVIVGFRFKFSASDTIRLFDLLKSGGQEIQLELTSIGDLRVLGPAVTQIFTTTALGLAANQWYYCEIQIVGHTSAGAIELYIDGTLISSSTGLVTGTTNTGYETLRFRNSSSTPVFYDDIYVASTAGSINNTYLGPVVIKVQSPISDVALTVPLDGVNSAFTPSTGTDNFAMVDEHPTDDDGTYISATIATGSRAWFLVDDVVGRDPLLNATVLGAQINLTAREATAGSGSLTLQARNAAGTTITASPSLAVTSSYNIIALTLDTEPGSSTPWTLATFQATNFGVQDAVITAHALRATQFHIEALQSEAVTVEENVTTTLNLTQTVSLAGSIYNRSLTTTLNLTTTVNPDTSAIILHLIEGFEATDTTDASIQTLLSRKYITQSPTSFHAIPGPISDRAVELLGEPCLFGRFLTFDGVSRIFIGFRFKVVYDPGATVFSRDIKRVRIFDLLFSGGQQLQVQLVQTGQIQILGPSVNVIASTATGLVQAGQWHYLELAFVAGPAGSINIKLDGIERNSTTQVKTTAGSAIFQTARFRNDANTNQVSVSFDDIYIQSGTGNLSDLQPGSCVVKLQLPDTDIALNGTDDLGYAEMIPFSGIAKFAMLDEIIADDDVTYLMTNTTLSRVVSRINNVIGRLAIDPGQILGVQSNTLVKRVSPGSSLSTNAVASIRVNGVEEFDYVSPGTVTGGLGTTYSLRKVTLRRPPGSLSLWTGASLQASTDFLTSVSGSTGTMSRVTQLAVEVLEAEGPQDRIMAVWTTLSLSTFLRSNNLTNRARTQLGLQTYATYGRDLPVTVKTTITLQTPVATNLHYQAPITVLQLRPITERSLNNLIFRDLTQTLAIETTAEYEAGMEKARSASTSLVIVGRAVGDLGPVVNNRATTSLELDQFTRYDLQFPDTFGTSLNLQGVATFNIEHAPTLLTTSLNLQTTAFALVEGREASRCEFSPVVGSNTEVDDFPTSLTLGTATLTLSHVTHGTIVLLNARFGDTLSVGMDRVNIVQRGNQLAIILDPTWVRSEILEFEVTSICDATVTSLKAFFINTVGLKVTLIDHFNREWLGYILTPDADFVKTGRESTSIRFQFDGVQQ